MADGWVMKSRLLWIAVAGALAVGALQLVMSTRPDLLPGYEEPQPLQFDRSRMVGPGGRTPDSD